MADLNVQPKRRAPVWPWLLLILVIAAVAYFVLRDKGVVETGTTSDSTSSQSADTTNLYHTDTTQYRTDTIRTDTTAR